LYDQMMKNWRPRY